MNTRTVRLAPRIAGTSLAPEAAVTPALPARAVEALQRRARQILDTIVAWQQRANSRALLKELGSRELHDIGLTRADVLVEADRPFWRL